MYVLHMIEQAFLEIRDVGRKATHSHSHTRNGSHHIVLIKVYPTDCLIGPCLKRSIRELIRDKRIKAFQGSITSLVDMFLLLIFGATQP